MKIALATSLEIPDKLDEDDDFLCESLNRKHIEYKILPWNSPEFINYPQTLIRSTWDYHKQCDIFLECMAKVPNLHNPYEVIKWNCDKKYLLELQDIVKIIPMILISPGDNIQEKVSQNKWNKAVLKPRISLGSLDTIIIRDFNTEEAEKLLMIPREFILQPFIEEIQTRGEISIIFIDGTLSHAIRKVPKAGDFRSQPEFGSNIISFIPTEKYRDNCQKILSFIQNKFGLNLLYARIDFIDCDEPMLIELELIEPCLYFKYHPSAADILVEALINK